MGSLSKDDGKAKMTLENNVLIGWMKKNNRAARAARTLDNSLTQSAKWQREISKFKVLTTAWTHNRNSFIVYVYFNGASTSPFAACSVNNNGCEEEAVKTQNSHHFSNDFKVTFSLPLSSLWLKLCNFKRLSPHDRFPQHKFSALPKANSSVC